MSIASIVRPPSLWVPSPKGGSSPYVAKAVHFDGSTYLRNASLIATDSGYFSFAFWIKYSVDNHGFVTIFVADPNNNYTTNIEMHNESSLFMFADIDNSNQMDGSPTIGTRDIWRSIVGCGQTNLGVGLKKLKIYVDDILVQSSPDDDFNSSFTMIFNGLPCDVGGDAGTNMIGDFADVRLMPGISLFNGSGDIPEATRRLFIDVDGKPVNPSVASTALGAPCILFSGDSSTFPVNQGTGGSFTLTGSLSNASTSPSD